MSLSPSGRCSGSSRPAGHCEIAARVVSRDDIPQAIERDGNAVITVAYQVVLADEGLVARAAATGLLQVAGAAAAKVNAGTMAVGYDVVQYPHAFARLVPDAVRTAPVDLVDAHSDTGAHLEVHPILVVPTSNDVIDRSPVDAVHPYAIGHIAGNDKPRPGDDSIIGVIADAGIEPTHHCARKSAFDLGVYGTRTKDDARAQA